MCHTVLAMPTTNFDQQKLMVEVAKKGVGKILHMLQMCFGFLIPNLATMISNEDNDKHKPNVKMSYLIHLEWFWGDTEPFGNTTTLIRKISHVQNVSFHLYLFKWGRGFCEVPFLIEGIRTSPK